MNELQRLLDLRGGGAVKRYHTARMIRQQNNAEHSFGVALLVTIVLPDASAELLKAALFHDLSELVTGDTPAHVKWENPKLAAVLEQIETRHDADLWLNMPQTDHERHVLKWCDMMELVLWCREELMMGNRFARIIMQRGLQHLDRIGHPTTQALTLYQKLLERLNYEQDSTALDDHY